MVFWLVLLYLLASIGIGVLAARRVSNAADYAVAGRSLPLYIVIATTFATWFGSEAVLGVSAVFVREGLGGVVEDPFGASMCLVLVGVFFAARLYKHNLLTLGDYYRERFGTLVEVLMSVAIVVSYLGWVAAQVKALGLVFHMLDPAVFSQTGGMIIGMLIVMTYTLFGGMWSVALTDFFQMLVIVAGLLTIAYFATDLAGGVGVVAHQASSHDLLNFLPPATTHDILFFFAALVTMMLGSIPQQDVYQRVMSSKDVKTARRGPVIGGLLYLLFACIPMYIGVAALGVMPDTVATLMREDPQKILPTFILERMPVVAQVFFFGALLSAIMSTASATLLAPSTTFAENILRHFVPGMSDKRFLLAMRVSVVGFGLCVLVFALNTSDSIYEMVAGAYTVTLVGAFVPLLMGLYWRRATTQGALLSAVLGVAAWLLVRAFAAEQFPPQLAGLFAGFAGMWAGSLLPQVIRARSRPALHPVL
ncbi:Sodium/pantothenate symporter [Pigmentiphaga humi]|uniref:Sodium/pantothenate symporter n=1 Tax=Pigmentiphaga humi TaxID=2478468 RepID=A0A3P4AW92_9BURK|nr:sodium:solute symporter family protein [Pigmentiphaga humi]VCU68002.1 Sodium/pantothenate symporter [Pigmentiphaga humi]